MVSDGDRTNVVMAFFAVRETADKEGYIGAVLVTDERGIPQEFRCTHPVRPTTAQRALYGDNLETHVTFELCGKPLIGALTTNPIACLVESRKVVGLREFVSLPILHIQRLGELLTVETGQQGNGVDSMSASGRSDRLDSETGGYQPLSVHCCKGFEDDIDDVRTALERMFERVDLLEPFERISTALKAVAERDERFR